MNDTVTFHNDDPGYAKWWGRNPAGFVAVKQPGSKDYMLHDSRCPSIDPTEGRGRTQKPRICGNDKYAVASQVRSLEAALSHHSSCDT